MPSGNHKVNYTCGHGDGVVLIQGTPEQRQYKLATRKDWLCPSCYRAEQDQAYKAKIAARRSTYDAHPVLRVVISHRKDVVYVLASGLWSENKDRLTALGYQFGRLSDVFTQESGIPMGRLFAGAQAPQSLYKALKAKDAFNVDPMAWLGDRFAETQALGYQPQIAFHDADMTAFVEAQKVCKLLHDDMIKDRPRPVRPEWYDDMIRKACEDSGKGAVGFNRTVYGGRGNRHVYLDGTKHPLTDAQGTELEAWIRDEAAWKEEYQRVTAAA